MARNGHRGLKSLLWEVPIDWLPTDPEEIEAFYMTGWMLATNGLGSLSTRTLVDSSKGNWRAFAERCLEATNKVSRGTIFGEGSSFMVDPVLDVSRHLALPIMATFLDRVPAPRDLMPAAATLVYGERSLPGCIEAAGKWHVHQQRIRAAVPDESDADGTRWPPLLQDTVIDGITVTALTSAGSLNAEGAQGPDANGVPGLDHCVASYRSRARAGETHILSLRRMHADGTYVRLATAEVRQEPDGSVELVQLRGLANADPEPACVEAMETILALPHAPPEMVERPGIDPVRDFCGYDWRDPTLVAKAYNAYAFLLPRDLRNGPGSLAAWLKAHHAKGQSADGIRPMPSSRP